MTRDVVDLRAAIAAAAEALRQYESPHGDGALTLCTAETAASAAVHAAADVLGIVDLSTVQSALRTDRRQHVNPPAVTTDTVTPQKDYL